MRKNFANQNQQQNENKNYFSVPEICQQPPKINCNKKQHSLCQACGRLSHTFTHCYFVLEVNKD